MISEDPKPPTGAHMSSPTEHPPGIQVCSKCHKCPGESMGECLFSPFTFSSVRWIPKSVQRNTVPFLLVAPLSKETEEPVRPGCREKSRCQTSCHYLTAELPLTGSGSPYLAPHFIRMIIPQEGPQPSC